MPTPTARDAASQLLILNRALTLGGLPPVTALSSLQETDDAAVCWRMIVQESRAAQARGWWFNTTHRRDMSDEVTKDVPVYNANTAQVEAYSTGDSIPYVIAASLSPKRAGDIPHDKFQRVSVSNPGQAGSNVTVYYQYRGQIPLVDYIKLETLETTPVQFVEYVTLAAARKFHRLLGVSLDPSDEQRAWEELLREQSARDNSEDHNVMNQSETLWSWIR